MLPTLPPQLPANSVSQKLFDMLMNAFGLVTALAWSDAVKSLFAVGGLLGFTQKLGVWFYAISITLALYLVTRYTIIGRWLRPTCTTLCEPTVEAVRGAIKPLATADLAAAVQSAVHKGTVQGIMAARRRRPRAKRELAVDGVDLYAFRSPTIRP